jgi:hypothetical protein
MATTGIEGIEAIQRPRLSAAYPRTCGIPASDIAVREREFRRKKVWRGQRVRPLLSGTGRPEVSTLRAREARLQLHRPSLAPRVPSREPPSDTVLHPAVVRPDLALAALRESGAPRVALAPERHMRHPVRFLARGCLFWQ